jgi:hypothetical protein
MPSTGSALGAVEYFSAKPVEGTHREPVSQWERTEHPELEVGFHANLLRDGLQLWNTDGYIGPVHRENPAPSHAREACLFVA